MEPEEPLLRKAGMSETKRRCDDRSIGIGVRHLEDRKQSQQPRKAGGLWDVEH